MTVPLAGLALGTGPAPRGMLVGPHDRRVGLATPAEIPGRVRVGLQLFSIRAQVPTGSHRANRS